MRLAYNINVIWGVFLTWLLWFVPSLRIWPFQQTATFFFPSPWEHGLCSLTLVSYSWELITFWSLPSLLYLRYLQLSEVQWNRRAHFLYWGLGKVLSKREKSTWKRKKRKKDKRELNNLLFFICWKSSSSYYYY